MQNFFGQMSVKNMRGSNHQSMMNNEENGGQNAGDYVESSDKTKTP